MLCVGIRLTTRVEATEWDVAIVGAGPAGAAAALGLTGSGLRVAILEAGTLPRHKTCGGGIVQRAARMLSVDFSATVEAECRSVELVHHQPAMRFACARTEPIISMVMRDRFDAFLVRQAEMGGAILFDGTRVGGITRGGHGFTLETSRGPVQARCLVAADGANSIVGRKIRAAPLRGLVPALEVECRVTPEDFAPWSGRARFDFGFVPAGYAWVFPKREHLSVGVLTTRRGVADLPRYFEKYCSALGIRPHREERHGFIIPCRPRENLFAHDGVFFVGDAAGLADPVTAEGISAAIQSGQLAAKAIRSAWPNALVAQQNYRVTLERAVLGELKCARRLAWILYDCPRLRSALWRWRGQAASEVVTAIVTGEHGYSELLGRRANYWKMFSRPPSPKSTVIS